MLNEILSKAVVQFHQKDVKTSSLAFKLLTRITVNLLIFCVALISLKEFFGGAIECVFSDSQRSYKKAIELKCWLEGVFVDRNLLNGTRGYDVISSGVGSAKRGYKPDYIMQSYYQWVVPVLLLEALLLFLPRALWHKYEDGMMKKLVGKSGDGLVINEDWENQKKYILSFLKESSTSQHHNYFFKYIICETLGILFLVIDMWIMQFVFNDFWSEYADAIKALLRHDFASFTQNAAKLFPKQAKCFFNMFGPSGTIQLVDVVCILPQNTVNEKVFAFLYFWMIFSVIVCVLNMVLIFCKLAFKPLRVREVRQMSNSTNSRFCWMYSDFGYWHLLRLLNQNLSPILFKDLVNDAMNDGKSSSLYPQVLKDMNDSGCSSLGLKTKIENLTSSPLASSV